jgi:hypothetical protein
MTTEAKEKLKKDVDRCSGIALARRQEAETMATETIN